MAIPAFTLSATSSIVDLVGDTPLIRLRKIERDIPGVELYAKAEWKNPGGSVKDRPALRMIQEGIASGQLTPDKMILDATSGNTGIAYAMMGAAMGYGVTLCVPENVTPERKRILRAYGAEMVFTNPLEGSDGAIRTAQRMNDESPGKFFYADQYNNPFNWRAHYDTTGPEIIRQTGGRLTHFVAGLGTSGTFVGAGRRLRELNQGIVLVSVQPDSPLHGLEGLKHMEAGRTKARVAGACGNRTHRSRRWRLHRGFEDRPDHQARSTPTRNLRERGDGLDLDSRAARQRGDRDSRSGGPVVAEDLGVDLVHQGEVGHVHQEDRGLHDGGEVGAAGAEDGPQILQHPQRLLRDAAVHQLPALGIESHLPRSEEKAVGLDPLAVRSDGARRPGRRDGGVRHQKSPSMVPSGRTRIDSAAGTLGRPGMVMMSPASATTNPAPAEG